MVDVDCVCGRRYTVPDDKAGKKLQCRRCGNVNRIPRPQRAADAVVIPFRDPGEEDGDGDDLLSLAPPEPPPLEIRDPLRRCPSCGFQDETSVLVCVRCGHDFRTGRRLADAHEQREQSERLRAVADASSELGRLAGMSWLAMTPLGLVLGPYLLARGFALERQARALGQEAAALNRIRALGAGGLLLWVVALGALGIAVMRRERDTDVLDRECRARLERVGAALRARLEAERRFPPAGGDWTRSLEGLVESPRDLVCPLGGDLYPYRRRDADVLTPQAEPDHLVLWEREPHLDTSGKLVLRALRSDGRVETFDQRSELEAATRRPAFAVGALPDRPPAQPTPATETPGPSGPATTPVDPPPGGERLRLALESFLAYAGSVDDTDPDFSQGVVVDPEFFTERVGIPPLELLPALLAGGDGAGGAGHPDDQVRVQAARMLARLELPKDRCVSLARRALRDPLPEARLGAAVCLHRHGDDGWLPAMASLLEEATVEETRRLAAGWIGREAIKGQAEVRRILEQAAAMRRKLGGAGADAIIPLPEGALEHVVGLLTDPAVRGEAVATLYSAGEAGVKAVLPELGSERPKDRRVAAFGVLDRLRSGGALPLEEYLRLLGLELDPEVRLIALKDLLAQTGEPPMPLLDWVMEALRRGAQNRLAEACVSVLQRAGFGPDGRAALERMIADLDGEGDRGPLLQELRFGGPGRQADERIDALLASRWSRIDDAATRVELARLLGDRPHEGAQRALLVVAEDPVEDVRIEALRGLKDALAVRGSELKREAARVIGQRLRAEDSPRVMEVLLALVNTGTFCEVDAEQRTHRCPVALTRGLEQLVRKGDRAATRALRAHPTDKTAEFLLSALEGAREDGPKQDIVVALQGITGVGLTSRDASDWRKQLQPLPPAVATYMANQAATEGQRQRLLQERAEQKVASLRAAAARPPR